MDVSAGADAFPCGEPELRSSCDGHLLRRGSKGFDPDLWSDAKQRPRSDDAEAWTADDDADGLDAIATNTNARFTDEDEAWLTDDPGEQIRNRKR